jgi:hypothetical protein
MPDGKVRLRLKVVQPYKAVYRHITVDRERAKEVTVMVDAAEAEAIERALKDVTEKRSDHIRLFSQPVIVGYENLEK